MLYPPFLLVYSTKELLIFGDIAILLHWSLTKQEIRQPDRAERGQRFRQFYLEVTQGLTASEMLAIHCCKEKLTLCTRMCQRKHTYFRFLHTKKKKIPLTLFISIYWKQVNVRGKKKVYPTIQPLVEQDFAAIPWINSYVSDFYLQCCLNLLMLMGICLCTALWMYYHSISVRFELGHCSTLNSPPPFFFLSLLPVNVDVLMCLKSLSYFMTQLAFSCFFFFLFPRIWL